MHKPVRIEARIRNNILWHMIFDAYKSVAEFCRKYQLSYVSVVGLLNLKRTAYLVDSCRYTALAKRLADIFAMPPEELFPAELYQPVVRNSTRKVFEIDFAMLPMAREALHLPAPDSAEDMTNELETRRVMDEGLKFLTEKEEMIVRARFGIDCPECTYEELARIYGLCKERVRQIEKNAIRKLRYRVKAHWVEGTQATLDMMLPAKGTAHKGG